MKTRDWLENLQTRAAKVARVFAGFCHVPLLIFLFVSSIVEIQAERRSVPRAAPVKDDWLRSIPRAMPVVSGQNQVISDGRRQLTTRVRPVVSSSRPAPTPTQPPVSQRPARRGTQELIDRCTALSRRGLEYQFGAAEPSRGGLDCSGTILYLLNGMGISGVPRTASAQYLWLEKRGTLSKVRPWTSPQSVLNKLRPGDLLFWKGTYDTGRYPNVSHVMIYLGRDSKTGQPLMFGASSRKSKGRNGNGVDVYPFTYPKKKRKGQFVGYGRVPGL